MYRKVYFIGIIAYLAMLAFAVLFYKERVILLDTAFSMFHIAKDGTFCIQIFRFGDAMNQVLPAIAVKAGLSLASVAISYSAGFVLYYFSCYLLTGFVFKRYDLALLILLIQLLFGAHTFYWIPSELPQGIAFLTLIFAYISTRMLSDIPPLSWIMLFLSMFTMAFFHPLLLFVLAYAVLFFFSHKGIIADKRTVYFIIAAYCCSVVIKAVAFKTPYEQHSLSGMKNFVTQFPDYFTLYSNRLFLHNITRLYYWMPLVFASVCVAYIRSRAWRNLFVFTACCVGYFFLVNISYPTSATPEFYRENLYTPFVIFLGLPFLFDVVPLLEKRLIAPFLLCLIIVSGCIRVYTTHSYYTARLNYERVVLDKYADKKIILHASNTDHNAIQMLWGTPYEIWLLSTIERGKTASIIIDDDPPHRDWAKHHTKDFIVNWDFFAYKDLPLQYFHLTDTVTGYTIDSLHIN